MASFTLKKTMTRKLTRKEDKQLLAYCEKHPDENLDDVVAKFEKKFKTTITTHHIMRLALAKQFR